MPLRFTNLIFYTALAPIPPPNIFSHQKSLAKENFLLYTIVTMWYVGSKQGLSPYIDVWNSLLVIFSSPGFLPLPGHLFLSWPVRGICRLGGPFFVLLSFSMIYKVHRGHCDNVLVSHLSLDPLHGSRVLLYSRILTKKRTHK